MNLFNSRWSPERRNLLNSSGWEGYEAPFDGYMPTTGFLDRVLENLGVPRTVMSATADDEPMPVFKPGEVSSGPEEYPRIQRAGPSPLPQTDSWFGRTAKALRNELTGEGRRESGVEELPPWVKISGQDTSGYSKIGLAGDNEAAAREIALKQFPGSSIREDSWGNAIIKLPDHATHTEWRVTGSDIDGNPTFEAKDVPLSGEYYLNRPGPSARDAANYAVEQAFESTGSFLGGLAAGAVGIPTVGVGFGAGLGAEAMDAAAQQAGSNQDIDWKNVIRAAAGEAGWDAAKERIKKMMMKGRPASSPW